MDALCEIAGWRFHTAVPSLVLLLLAATVLSAATADRLQAPQSAAQDLSNQVGRTRAVCGIVSATRKVKNLTYLDLAGKVGDEAVSVALELSRYDDFLPKRALGLRICATGKIRQEKNTPGFIVKLEDTRGLRSAVLPPNPPSDFFGDAVTPARVPNAVNPRERKFIEPRYTSEAMRAHVVGMATLECVVRIDGTTGACRVVNSLDALYGLDDEALRAVRKWTFYPAHKDGVPFAAVVTLEVMFRLH